MFPLLFFSFRGLATIRQRRKRKKKLFLSDTTSSFSQAKYDVKRCNFHFDDSPRVSDNDAPFFRLKIYRRERVREKEREKASDEIISLSRLSKENNCELIRRASVVEFDQEKKKKEKKKKKMFLMHATRRDSYVLDGLTTAFLTSLRVYFRVLSDYLSQRKKNICYL